MKGRRVTDDRLCLSGVHPGETVRIVSIESGHGLHRRLADMGMIPGTVVRVLRGHGMGPTLVEFRGSQLMLGFGVAHKIVVEKETGGK